MRGTDGSYIGFYGTLKVVGVEGEEDEEVRSASHTIGHMKHKYEDHLNVAE